MLNGLPWKQTEIILWFLRCTLVLLTPKSSQALPSGWRCALWHLMVSRRLQESHGLWLSPAGGRASHVDRVHAGFGTIQIGAPVQVSSLTTRATLEKLLWSQVPHLKNGDDTKLMEPLQLLRKCSSESWHCSLYRASIQWIFILPLSPEPPSTCRGNRIISCTMSGLEELGGRAEHGTRQRTSDLWL